MILTAVTNNIKNMDSRSDFEKLFIRYKAESMPQGESIQDFCLKNNVSHNLFHKWYKDTRHQIVPVQVEGEQEPEANLRKGVPFFPIPDFTICAFFMICVVNMYGCYPLFTSN